MKKTKKTPDAAEPTGAAVIAGDPTEKPKPFANAKPRSEWRTPIRRVKGKVKFDCHVAGKSGPELQWFTAILTAQGLRVHRDRARKSTDKVWPLEVLANGVNKTGQMEMFQPKGKTT